MDEAGLGTDHLRQMGQEGDDIVPDFLFDRCNAPRIEPRPAAALPDDFGGLLGNRPRSAIACAAWASISNQIRKRVSGAHSSDICGRA